LKEKGFNKEKPESKEINLINKYRPYMLVKKGIGWYYKRLLQIVVSKIIGFK